MEKQKECRVYPRLKCEEPVDILGGRPLKFFSALMLNFSVSGLYVEISDPLQSGDMIVVKPGDNAIFDPVTFGAREQRLAEVRWCLETDAGNARRYGCGAQYM